MISTKITVRKNRISMPVLLVASFCLSAAITFTYGRSITALYALLSLALSFSCIYYLITHFYKFDVFSRRVVVALCIASMINGFIRIEIKSPLLLSSSLILPLVISILDIDESKPEKRHMDFVPACALALMIVLGQSIGRLFVGFNSNSFAFFGYMGISIGVLWYTTSKNKLIPLCYLALGASLLLGTGSRNVAIIILLCFLMVLLPEKVYKNPYVFFMFCAIPLIYTIFAKDILDFAFSNEKIAELLYDYTEQFSEKAWDMAERVAFLTRVNSIISSRGFFENIFGEGSLQGHCHNLFYQSVLVYGYAGAALIYAWYIRVLWMGYCLIKENDDSFALGCVIIMLGHFWLQGADVYMVGAETCAIVPQVIMGLIMQRYRANKNKLMAWRGTV